MPQPAWRSVRSETTQIDITRCSHFCNTHSLLHKMYRIYVAVVRALAFHQCSPGSIPGPGIICGLSLLLVLVLAPRAFLRVLRFSSLHIKKNISKFQFDLDVKCLLMSPWLGRLGNYSPNYDVKFDLILILI